MEFLFEYGLFLAKALTIVAAIVAVLVLGMGLSRRSGEADDLEITHLNDHYRRLGESIEHAMLDKEGRKAKAKARKAADKAKAKARKKTRKDTEESSPPDKPRIYVLDFEGDIRASGSDVLRQEVTAVLAVATERDEVLVRIENAGGMVHGHGLAASQLARIAARSIPLTVAIDKVAASGGYLMACVADKIVAAPFAIIGSIGVLAQIPNFHRLLDRAGVDFELIKAGQHKRSLTFFGKNTEEDRAKMQSDVDAVHALFKRFVNEHRPALDIESVATGEHWHGTEALERGLIDEIATSDDYLLQAAGERDIYAVHYEEKKPLSERLGTLVSIGVDRVWERLTTDTPRPG